MFQFFYCCQNGSSYVEFVGHRSWSRVSVSTVYPFSGAEVMKWSDRTEEHSDKKNLKKVVDFNWFDFLFTEVNSWFNFSSGTLRHRVKSFFSFDDCFIKPSRS